MVEMTEKMKALGNDFIEKCENQGLTFEEWWKWTGVQKRKTKR